MNWWGWKWPQDSGYAFPYHIRFAPSERARRALSTSSLQFRHGSPIKQDPKDFFAAERTFLAWIRTGLGLIGIGFAVSRFSLFLREIAATDSHAPVRPTGVSMWSGVALVGLGVIVILSSCPSPHRNREATASGLMAPRPRIQRRGDPGHGIGCGRNRNVYLPHPGALRDFFGIGL